MNVGVGVFMKVRVASVSGSYSVAWVIEREPTTNGLKVE